MSKTMQVLKMNDRGGKYSVVYHENDKMNPFWVYRHTWELRECGYGYGERKRIVVKYADMKSCLCYLASAI